MYRLHFAPTPNGWKPTIMLEECGLEYELVQVNIGAGEQFDHGFVMMNHNTRIPVLEDTAAEGGSLFVAESAAILMYLAHKTGRFVPLEEREYYQMIQWLFWQMAHQGPTAGQAGHFVNYAPPEAEYGRRRFLNEYDRMLGVLNLRLACSPYLAGDEYTIADMANFPWLMGHSRLCFDPEQFPHLLGSAKKNEEGLCCFDLQKFPHLFRWYQELGERPAVRRGVETGRFEYQDKDGGSTREMSEEIRKILFNQTSEIYARSLAQLTEEQGSGD